MDRIGDKEGLPATGARRATPLGRFRRAMRLSLPIAAWVVACLWGASPLRAQVDPAAPAAPSPAEAPRPVPSEMAPPRNGAPARPAEREGLPEFVPRPPDLTAETVRSRLEQVQTLKDLDEAIRKRAVDSYNQALEQLRIADEHANRSAALTQLRQQAPAAIADLQARAAEPVTEPTIEVPPAADVRRLQQELLTAEEELTAARKLLSDLEAQRARRTERRTKIPEELPAAKQRLEEVEKSLAAPPPATDPAEVVGANRAYLQARRQALSREIEKLELEVPTYDATFDMVTLQLADAARRAARAERVRKLWEEAVQRRRTREADEIVRWVRELSQHAPQEIAQAPLTQRVKSVAESRTRPTIGLPDLIRRATDEIGVIEARLKRLEEDQAALEQKLELTGMEQFIGPLLLNQRRGLPDVGKLRRNIRARERTISRVRLDLMYREEERVRLPDVETQIAEFHRELPQSLDDEPPELIALWVRGLVESWRNLLDSEIADGHTYLTRLVDLSGLEQQLVNRTEEFREIIDQHILWIRSTERLETKHFRDAADAIGWLIDGDNWRTAEPMQSQGPVQALWSAIVADPLIAGTGVLVFILLLVFRGRFRRRLQDCGERASVSYTQPFRYTGSAFLWTLLIALPGPGLMWLVGWELATFVDSSDFARSIGLALVATAGLFLATELYRQVFRPMGLGAQHFRWRPERLRLNRGMWRLLQFVALPLVFLVMVTESQDRLDRRDSLGRLALMAGLLLLSAFIARLLQRSLIVPRNRLNDDPTVSRWKFAAYVVVVGAPLVLVALAGMGYHYTALELTRKLIASAGLGLGLILAHAMIARWLYALRARLALEQVAARQVGEQETAAAPGQSATDEAGGTLHPGTETVEVPRQTVDLGKINQQTRRLLRNVTTVAAIFGVWLIWRDILPALGILNQTIWTTEVQVTEYDGTKWVTGPMMQAFTIGHLLFAAVILAVVIVAARNLPGLLHVAVLQYLPLDAGGLYAVNTLLRYLIVMVGIVIMFGAIGVAWSHVQWLVAAVGVGLGFGLQEIFANFVSGLILLFERPIRVGDIVTVENVSGVVVDIRMRATTVRDWDYKEFIIPNKDLVTGKLLNWTLANPTNRLVVNVGVSYDCKDTEQARQLLMKVARANPHVLTEPGPLATFEGFGDNSLNFVLRAYLPNLENRLAVIHDLHSSIFREFREAGVEIAFPQRDIHIRSIQGVLPVEERRRKAKEGEGRSNVEARMTNECRMPTHE